MKNFYARQQEFGMELEHLKSNHTLPALYYMYDWPDLVSGAYAPIMYDILENRDTSDPVDFYERLIKLYNNRDILGLKAEINKVFIVGGCPVPNEISILYYTALGILQLSIELIADFDQLCGFCEAYINDIKWGKQ